MSLLIPSQAAPDPLVVRSITPEKPTQYNYSPLKDQQIRLIELLPADEASPIECKNIHSSLDDTSQPYECLSYMWGPPSQPQSISMDGKPFNVGINLEAALSAIRDKKNSRKVWVDALCINQDDVQERSSQVALMGRIFHGAIKVLIWLGEAADDSDILFEHIVYEDLWSSRWEGPLDQQCEKAMLAFYRRPYWRRVWIIQEIYTAKAIDLFCGSKSMQYFMFHSGYFSFESKMERLKKDGKIPPGCTDSPESEFFQTPGARIIRNRGIEGKLLEDFSLLRLLELCAECKSECKLTHDRVYALIGILKSSQSGIIIPDYSKTLSELYIDVLISTFVPDSAKDAHYISVWGYAGKDLVASTRLVQGLLEDPLWDTKANNFHPLGNICNAPQLEKMRRLRLDVWIEGIGVIKKVGDPLTPEEFLNREGDSLPSWVTWEYARFRDALEELTKRELYLTQEIGTRYMKKLTDPATGAFDPIEDPNITQDNVSAIPNGINRPFKTKNGVVGFASSTIQKGDLLYGFMALTGQFLGSALFLIIRPGNDPSIHSFTLIGRAILLPVPRERFCAMRTQKGLGKFVDFNFKGDLDAQGISLNEEVFEDLSCYMDITTLFLLTR